MDGAGQRASALAGGGFMRAECLDTAIPKLKSHRGQVREGGRGTTYTDALLGSAGVEMGRNSSARRDTEGTSSHHENSESKPATKVDFHLGAVFFALR